MPQLQNLVLLDRAATPVSHTFVPRGISRDGVATVVKNDGTLASEQRVTIATRRNNGNVKTRIVISRPVAMTETINGVSNPKIVRTAYADVTFTFSLSSSEQERNDLVGMLADALGTSKSLINDSVVKGQDIY